MNALSHNLRNLIIAVPASLILSNAVAQDVTRIVHSCTHVSSTNETRCYIGEGDNKNRIYEGETLEFNGVTYTMQDGKVTWKKSDQIQASKKEDTDNAISRNDDSRDNPKPVPSIRGPQTKVCSIISIINGNKAESKVVCDGKVVSTARTKGTKNCSISSYADEKGGGSKAVCDDEMKKHKPK